MMGEPGALSVAELRDTFRARRASALELTQACLAGIAARDGAVHGFVSVIADAALAEARAVDAAAARGTVGPLAGVPVAIKDLLSVRGVGRGNGSPAFAGAAPERNDATVVTRLRAAGAVVVGTTHMHELAFGTTGVNPGLGTPVNAWGTDRVPGGSSSGSGAVLAAGLVPAALGSDTGGSIRIPASFCGITGLKPTYGRVSRAGATTLAWTLDHVGPMARSARDVALLLQALAGYDPLDPSSARLPVPDYVAALERPLRGVRVGVPRHFCCALLDGDVAAAFDAVARHHASGRCGGERRRDAVARAHRYGTRGDDSRRVAGRHASVPRRPLRARWPRGARLPRDRQARDREPLPRRPTATYATV